jgi:hypothetical protein
VTGEADECDNHDYLSREDRSTGVLSEPSRASVENGEDDDEQHCRSYRDILTPLALRELGSDPLTVPTHCQILF